jgi:protocatechuate 3,4-dioxygenase beta subunit
LSVTVFINQSYDPGQPILISGQVLDENLKGVQSASVSIQANDPNGNPIHVGLVLSSADGNYTDQFTTPSNPINGGYTVYVTASKPGYTDGNSQAACIITPEFPISDVPWLAVFPIALLVLVSRKQHKHTESLTPSTCTPSPT